MKYFEKLLIANRGEIAIRIMRACRELDIDTVAIYSDADKNALHVKYADEAFHVGEAHPSKSYLNMERILDIAKKSGAKESGAKTCASMKSASTASKMAMRNQRKPMRHFRQKPELKRITERSPEW